MILSKRFAFRKFSRSATIPDHLRIYAIGDIHGRADLLSKMHKAIAEHAADGPPADNYIIYLGDYVDRGLQVKEVVNTLVTDPLPGFTSVYLKGNHEEMLLEFMDDPASLDDWLLLGGQATLLSYGVDVTSKIPDYHRAEEIRQAFSDALPKAHLEFLSGLKISHQVGDYLFVHAGLRPGIPIARQLARDCVWIREPFLSNRKHLGARVVHGHNITPHPEILPFRIGVDTGAYATGRLSCVMLEANQAAFLTIHGDGNCHATV